MVSDELLTNGYSEEEQPSFFEDRTHCLHSNKVTIGVEGVTIAT